MKSRLGVWPYVLGGCTLLIALACTPILASLVLVVGVGGYLAAMTVLIVTWIVALVETCQPILTAQGRCRFRGRPRTAIGGKHWSPPAVNVVMWGVVIAMPFVAWGYTYWGGDKAYAWSLLGLAAMFAPGLIRERRRHTAAHAALLTRECLAVDELWSQVQKPSPKYLDSLQCVEEVMAVPYGNLRATDRFGVEIGSLSFFDETLDILTSKLLRSREPPASFDVGAVKTLEDYVEASDRLRGRPRHRDAPAQG